MIQELEQAIVDRLLADPTLTRFQVEAWPEDAASYKFKGPFGALLVTFKGSTYGPSLSTDAVVQMRNMEFEITTLCRDLRDHTGGYAALEAIRNSLTGWRAANADGRAFMTRDGFVGEDDGVWEFASYATIPVLSSQDATDANAFDDEQPLSGVPLSLTTILQES